MTDSDDVQDALADLAAHGSPDACVKALRACIMHVRACERQGMRLDGLALAMTGVDQQGTRLVSVISTDMDVGQALDLLSEAEEYLLEELAQYENDAPTAAVEGSVLAH